MIDVKDHPLGDINIVKSTIQLLYGGFYFSEVYG